MKITTLYVTNANDGFVSSDITKEWVKKVEDLYARIDVVLDGEEKGFHDDKQPMDWHEAR